MSVSKFYVCQGQWRAFRRTALMEISEKKKILNPCCKANTSGQISQEDDRQWICVFFVSERQGTLCIVILGVDKKDRRHKVLISNVQLDTVSVVRLKLPI